MTLKKEVEELINLKSLVESDEFQKYIAEPLRKKQDKLRLNFFSDSLKEAWRKGGKYEGINEFFKILKDTHNDLNNKKIELESQQENSTR